MATIFNTTDCTTTRKNVGFSDCFADVKVIRGLIKVPSSFYLDEDDLSSIAAAVAALKAAAKQDSKGLRLYPVHRLKNPQDSTDDVTIQTYSDGSEVVVREGLAKWSFQVTNGGLCLHRSLRTHNQNGGYFLFYDANFTLYGWAKNKGQIWGIPLDRFWTAPWKMTDGSSATAYNVALAFAPRYVNESVGYAQLDSTLEGVEGLQDIILNDYSFAGDTGIAQVTALLDCGSVNMAELYATELADPALWVATNAQTGEEIDITDVSVVNGSDKRFQVTLDTGDSDYDPDGTTLLSLAAPSVLEAAGVEGYESDELELATASSS